MEIYSRPQVSLYPAESEFIFFLRDSDSPIVCEAIG